MCQNLNLQFHLLYCLFMLVFSFLFIRPFCLLCVSVFLLSYPPFSYLVFYCPSSPSLFHLCFCPCFSAPESFISSLPEFDFFYRQQQGSPLLCRNFIAINRKQSYIEGQLPKVKKSSTIYLSIQFQRTKLPQLD
jgi:hypothetical protein